MPEELRKLGARREHLNAETDPSLYLDEEDSEFFTCSKAAL